MTKRILCTMVILIMVGMLALPVFATSGDVDYSVKYISKTLEKAEVEYAKKYRVIYERKTNLSNLGLSCQVRVTVGSTVLNPKNPNNQTPNTKWYYDSLPKYKIELRNMAGTFETKQGTLENNKVNEITIKHNGSAGGYWKYKVDIKVTEKDNENKIIETVPTSGWTKVENPNRKGWKTKVYTGEQSELKLIGINETNNHSTSEKIYGKAKMRNTGFLVNWVSTTKELESKYGEVRYNTLEKIIKPGDCTQSCENKPYWYRWRFKLKVIKKGDEPTDPTPTPSDDPTPTPSDDPTPTPTPSDPNTSDDPDPTPTPSDNVTPTSTPVNTNYYGDTLPKTGESDSKTNTIIGISIMSLGILGAVVRKIVG